MVNKARLIENIADLVKDKRIEGISDLNDESNRKGMRIVIELKREANPQVVLNQLYRYTQLQDTVGVIMLALDGGVPKVMTLKDMLQKYVDFQDSVVRRRTQHDLKKGRRARAYSGGPETRHRYCGRNYRHHPRLQGRPGRGKAGRDGQI